MLDLDGMLFGKIEEAYERRRGDTVGFAQEASLLVAGARLTPSETELAFARIRELAQTLPVKLASSEEVSRATALCRQTAQRLSACAGYNELIGTWPAPIAHEMRQLVRVLERKGREASPEAALLQLRDVTETLVKLPASVLASRLLERGGDNALEMRRLLAKVSGSAWNELACSAAERIRQVEPDGPLATLAGLFAQGSRYRGAVEALGQARNTYLGHGAMRSNPSETAEIVQWVAAAQPGDSPPSNDMARKPTLIDALESGTKARPWTGLRLEAVAENGSAIDLTGAAALDRWLVDPRHVGQDGRVLRVRLVRDDGAVALELGPLVAARICRECGRRDVFFFETVYDRKPWRIDFLDYGRGHKSRFTGDETAELRAELFAIPLQDIPSAMAEEGLERGAAIAGLDRLRVEQRYLSPTYLREPLARFLKERDRGTYWLQAPAQVGKTMFVLGLADASLADSPVTSNLGPGSGGGIAAFFCKREYREGRYTFLNDLSDELKTALDLRGDKNALFPKPSEVITADDKGQAFVAWLDRWRMLAKRADRPLLIAIDGLDEVDPPSGGDSLLDLLPKPSELTRGLYFLLTSRRIGDVDCPPWLGPAVAPLASEPRRLDVDDCGYRTLLTAYVCKALDPTNERRPAIAALSERLIAQAEDRFAFLSFLVEQLRGGQQLLETIGALGTGAEIYDRFIDSLETRYGTKRADVVLDVLTSLAAAELAHEWTFGEGALRDAAAGGMLEPLPRVWPGVQLDVLAAATELDERQSDGTVLLSVPFVEALIVLRGTLWVWRGHERDGSYRLGLKEFAKRSAARRHNALRRAYSRLAGLCLDAVESLSQESSGLRDSPAERTFRALFGLLPGLVTLSGAERLHKRFRNLTVIEKADDIEFAREEAASRRQIAFPSLPILAPLTHGAGAPRKDAERRSDDAHMLVTAETARIKGLAHSGDGDPFGFLGMHRTPEGGLVVRAFRPNAASLELIDARTGAAAGLFRRIHPYGVFLLDLPEREPFPYRLRENNGVAAFEFEDPYRFGKVLSDLDTRLIRQGNHLRLWEVLGAHLRELEGVRGTTFAVWAPNARRVSVVGDFNDWDGRVHAMRFRGECGVWEIFIPVELAGNYYKYELVGPDDNLLPLRADPVGFAHELRPATASIVVPPSTHVWSDAQWMERRGEISQRDRPIAIYEVHLGSWRRKGEHGDQMLTYRELADTLLPYVRDLGFTHIELLPITEHPFDGSWGYQTTGMYAPTSRHGSPDDFRAFIDRAHAEGIGVILDWVPGHFPADTHSLVYFDGTQLYEHEDMRKGFHVEWGTFSFNFGRNEVSNFLIASALFWLGQFHIDGLRVDAVSSIVYLDYGRRYDEWLPNTRGGNENLEGSAFLRRLNTTVYRESPTAMSVAEESTAFPMVSWPADSGGLGFGYKWNMGWMHDTLRFFSVDPLFRGYHLNELSFGIWYAWTENFILPFSHDEVVHLKRSLLGRMPGDDETRFASLRALYAFMYMHPGKKLLFMGAEFAQESEWSESRSLDWDQLRDNPRPQGVHALIRDLNRFYRESPALYTGDAEPAGFEWIDCTDATNLVISFLRRDPQSGAFLVVVLNASGVAHPDYRIGVPKGGAYRQRLNTDAEVYGGRTCGNLGEVRATEPGAHGRPYALSLTLPPQAVFVLEPA